MRRRSPMPRATGCRPPPPRERTSIVEFDADLTYTSFDQHMHKEKTPGHRAHLETVVSHSKGEVIADLDMVLATLSDDPQYREYGVYANARDDTGPKGAEAVRRTYEAMVANGSYVIESKKDRVVVSDDEIVTAGTFRQILTAQVAKDMGFVGEDADGYYMLSARTIVFWAFDDEGKVTGEERFVMNHEIVPIAREDLPAHYPAHLRQEAQAQR
jgi:hypothetical protein